MKLYRILILLLALISAGTTAVRAQDEPHPKAKELFRKAYGYYLDKHIDEARTLLKKAIGYDSAYAEPHMMLADVYHYDGRYDLEEQQLKTLIRLRPDYPGAYYNLGTLQLGTDQFAEAIGTLEYFLEIEEPDSRFVEPAERKLATAKFAKKAVEFPVPFDPQNIGTGVNTKDDEYWPVLTADERVIFFTRRNQAPSGMYFEDIWMSTHEGRDWAVASRPPGKLNTPQNEGAITISPDGKWIMFAGCNWPDGEGSCDLYVSRYENGLWTEPMNLRAPINTRHKETQPSLSYDGQTLYFSSSRPGGSGGLDLWKSTFNQGSGWGAPVNLGPEINTEDHEQSPFIHHDDQTLYFSSRGHIGMGGADLFRAKRQPDGSWGEPENMGYPINNSGDELSIFVTSRGNQAYIASQENSVGGLDIFSFELYPEARPEAVTYLKANVFDAENGEKLEALVELYDLEKREKVLGQISDETGVLMAIPANKDYALHVSKEGYLFYSDHLPLKDYESQKPYEKDIELQPIKVGEKVVLRNIFYGVDSFELKPRSRAELDLLTQFLEKNSSVKIEVSGHTDSDASEAYNQELSEKRATQVKEYLVKQGIPADRLIAKGYGESQPIASNATTEGKAQNRRTELKIIAL